MPLFMLASSMRYCICLMLLAAVLSTPHVARAAEGERLTKAAVAHITWNQAPKFIQEQIRNVVLNCTEGTLTPDKARIFEFTTPDQLPNYVYDYSAWEQQPLMPNCQNSPIMCNESGCLVTAYTQIKPDVFKQSLRTYVLKLAPKQITEHAADGSVITSPGFEMVQSKFSCRLVNGGTSPCAMNFTWKQHKFTYFGFGAKDDQGALEPQHEKVEKSDQEDNPE